MTDTIRTQQDLLDNVFQDGQPANSISAQDVRDLIVSAPYFNEYSHGWEFLFDNTYTESSPLVVTQNTPTQLTCDGARANLRYPSDFTGAWDTTQGILKPAILNGFGIVRVSFVGETLATANPNYFDIEVKTGFGSPIIFGSPSAPGGDWIWKSTQSFIKGQNVHQHFNFVMPLFVGAQFASTGAVIELLSTTSSFNVYDIAITAHRTFAPNPA